MKISGFSYVRNGFNYDVPFLEAIQSILPICDEFVIAVGDSTDGTREAIVALNSPKIKIIDTVWDSSLREGGKIFAQQANIALDHISGDWAFHIQADEVIHENDLAKISNAIRENANNQNIDGFLLPFLHFWGGYNYIRTSRRVHKHEIRIFRNEKCVRSYRDSQGFRIYSSKEAYEQGEENGKKLHVLKIDAPVYHYSAVRTPKKMSYKTEHFNSFWHKEIIVSKQHNDYDYQKIDRLSAFTGTHPEVMRQKVAAQDWEFVFDPKKSHWSLRNRILQPIEDFLGYRFGEYKNYILHK